MPAATDSNVVGLLRQRAALFRAIRAFFDERGFLEVDTPAIVPSPGLDVHLSAFGVGEPDLREQELDGARNGLVGWLATSPEYQMKRLLAGGAERIYQLGKSFRSEEQGHIHEREFTMLEWYRAHASSEDVMCDTEDLVRALAVETGSGLVAKVPSRWPRRTVTDVVQEYASLDAATLAADEERFFRVWAERVQPQLGLETPMFVTHWPASMASLAKLNDDGTADRFEAFAQGIELCNGFGELTDPVEQRARFEADQASRKALGKPAYPIDERFLDALERGLPPSGGNALGVDRLLMLLTGADSIQEVMTFPAETL